MNFLKPKEVQEVMAQLENNNQIDKTMNTYQKKLIVEHAELAGRITRLDAWIYGKNSEQDNKDEFANKCIQLKGMRIYEEALRARLVNAGIVFEGGQYFERVAAIEENNPCPCGSDYDVDDSCENKAKCPTHE